MGFGRSMKLICTAIADQIRSVLEGRRAWQINAGEPVQDLFFLRRMGQNAWPHKLECNPEKAKKPPITMIGMMI